MQSATLAPRKSVEAAFWTQSLGYAHAAVAAIAALVVGLIFHFTIGYRAVGPPLAAVGIPALIGCLIAGRFARGNAVVRWLTGIPFAIVSTGVVGLLALAGAVIPQGTLTKAFMVPSIWASWPFLMAALLMTANLVGSVGRRSWPLTYCNVVYLLSHAGLATVIVGGTLSASTLERNNLILFEGQPSSIALDALGHEHHLPFQVTLRDFTLETFPPTFILATLDATSKQGFQQLPGQEFVREGLVEYLGGQRIEVLRFLPRAVAIDGTWRAVPWKTGAPAAFVRVTTREGIKREGWVSSGGQDSGNAMLGLSKDQALLMPTPRPRRFRSKVDIIDGQKTLGESIEVNKPLHVGGYDLYQLSYDAKAGAASEYSIIEVVRDRGIGIVYAGIFALLLGSILHLWNGVGGKS